MNRALSFVTVLLLGLSTLAAGLSQLTLSISTQGPDYYADGTPVCVGETYLLVYVAAGATFGGIRTDGSLVDPAGNKIATKAVAVAGAKCGFKAIQYPAALYPDGGSWVIVLLDTRDANGAVGGLVAGLSAGPATGAAPADSARLNDIQLAGKTGGAPTLSTSTLSQAPADTPAPVIAAVKPQGETVRVSIQNFTDKAIYEVQSTDNLAAGAWQPAAGGTRVQATAQNVVAGAGGGSELPVSVQVPANDNVRFFRVIVPGSN